MVLDRGPPTLPAAPKSRKPDKSKTLQKETEKNGLLPKASAAGQQPPGSSRQTTPVGRDAGGTGCRAKVSRPLSNGHSGWMRRTESSCSVNSTGSACFRSGIRNATSLPHIPRNCGTRTPPAFKSPCLLVALRPANVEEEKERFFKSDFTYDPQFEYVESNASSMVVRYSVASDRFINQAVRILQCALKQYGSYENFEVATGGSVLAKSKIWASIRKYMQKEGCAGEVVVRLSDDLLSQAVMMVENSRPTLTINLGGARQYWLEGMLRHEIGTHYIRGANNQRQPWCGAVGRKRMGLKPANPTEEGLASLHSVLFRKFPFLWRAALLYYTVLQASQMTFCQLFHDIVRFVEDPNTRWEYCVRAKRGQTDTSQPGCFSKDQVYLDGVLMLLRYRKTIDFKLLMALGKVSFEDVDELKKHAVLDRTRIPHFMQDQERYLAQLDHIRAVNGLTDEELAELIPE
uniref:Microtubule associated tyrosine carboxypeptidase 1 n=1 Tax=Callorhinchus milii TaxID=7868 RepID=A0A4W3IR78_CALMI|eukprot:gi/632975127/ref/XP_007904052.1/ PREDICTED: uncharacterized protein KIAA0895-like homolog [Callorhinchus milii]